MIGRNKMYLASRALIIFLSMLNLIIVKNNFVKKKILETIQAVKAVIFIKKGSDTKIKIITKNTSTKAK
jgi:hypothetical protein